MILKFVALVFILATSLNANAEVENPNLLPLGDREAYMGNAGVALQGSPGNIFYNPAGLGKLTGRRISAGGSAYALVKGRLQLLNENVDFHTIQTVPNMVASTKRFENITVGFGVFVPMTFEGTIESTQGFPLTGGTLRLNSQFKTDEQYIGLAAGKELTHGWSVGAGLFAHRYVNKTTNNLFLTPDGGGSTINMSQFTFSEFEVISLFPVIGAQYEINDHWLLGMKVSTPDLKILGKSRLKYYQFLDDGINPTTTTIKDEEHSANYKMPADVLIGGTWKDSRNLVTFSNGIQLPTKFESMPGSSESTHTETKVTMRQSLGFEHVFPNNKAALIGFMRNPSASTNDRNSSGDQDPQTHFYSVSVGYHDREPKFISGIGASYAVSQQKEKVFAFTPDKKVGYQIFMITVSTSVDY